MQKLFLFFIILLTVFSCQNNDSKISKTTSIKLTQKDKLTYQQAKILIDSTRLDFRKKYAEKNSNKTIILLNIKNYLTETIGANLYNYWSGTHWDFNGTTTIPKNNKIVCSLFVTTVLYDTVFIWQAQNCYCPQTA